MGLTNVDSGIFCSIPVFKKAFGKKVFPLCHKIAWACCNGDFKIQCNRPINYHVSFFNNIMSPKCPPTQWSLNHPEWSAQTKTAPFSPSLLS